MVTRKQKSRQIFHAIGSVLMALSVLIQFSFVSVNTMSCVASGNQVINVGELEDACCTGAESSETTVSKNCCEYGQSEKQFHTYHEANNDFSSFLQVAAIQHCTPWTPEFFVEENVEMQLFANPPPNLSGRDLLTHISKFTI